MKQHIDIITEICISNLLNHIQNADDVPYKEDTDYGLLTLNLLGDGEKISWDSARTYLAKAIKDSITLYNKVLLYTCKDNALISIEKLENIETEDLENYHKLWDNLEFYIGYD